MKHGAKFRSAIILKTREGNIDDVANEIPVACYFGRDEFEELPDYTDLPALSNYFNF